MSGEESKTSNIYQDVDVPNGLVFAPLRKNWEKITVDHPLDNDIAGLWKVLNEIIIPACCEFTPAPQCFSARIKKILEYTIPANGFCFSFPVELLYRFLAPEDQQTKENMEFTKILRIIIEILFAGISIQDDIVDHSDERLHKKAWHTICPGGTEAAIFDAYIVNNMSYHLLKRFFSKSSVYVKMLEAINEGLTVYCIGQLVDFCEKETILLAGNSNELRSYKTGQLGKFLVKLPLLYAGVTDEIIIEKIQKVFFECFIAIQESNDFANYYCPRTVLGKESDDTINGTPTWVSQTAVTHFDEEQRKTFFSCFGSLDPVKIQTVIDLYNKINITELYIAHMNEMGKRCESYIEELPYENLKEACTSIKQWIFGGSV